MILQICAKLAFGLCKTSAKLIFGFCKISAKLAFGFYENRCQINIWAFDKILPRVVLGLLVFVKFCQTSIWAFVNKCQSILGFMSSCQK